MAASTFPKANPSKNKSLERWIWDAACSIRGAKDAPKYKDCILRFIFTKCLCDVFDDEIECIAKKIDSRKKAFQLAKLNPLLEGIIDRVDFNAITHGQRDFDDDRLSNLIKAISTKRHCLADVEIIDTFSNPKLRGKLRAFDRVVATAQRGSGFPNAKPYRRASRREDNPIWNQDEFSETDYDADELDRISAGAGFSGKSSADCPSLRSRPAGWLCCAPHCSTANAAGQWGWVQHMHSSPKADGRAAVELDTGTASRSSGNTGTNKEKIVRQWFVDHDYQASKPR